MIKRGKFIAHWLLQPGMYHYRRAIVRETNPKRIGQLMLKASLAFYGISPKWRYWV